MQFLTWHQRAHGLSDGQATAQKFMRREQRTTRGEGEVKEGGGGARGNGAGTCEAARRDKRQW